MPETYNIGVTGDASQLKQEISTIDTQISNIGKNSNPRILNDWKEKLAEIDKQAQTVYNTLNKFNGSVSMPTKDFDKMNTSARDAIKQMNDLKSAIDTVGRSGKFDGKGVTEEIKQAYSTIDSAVKKVNSNLRDTSKIRIKPDVNTKDAIREIELLNKQTQRSKDVARTQTNKKQEASKDQRDIMQAKRISNDGMRTGKISYNDRQRLNEQIGRSGDYRKKAATETSAVNRYTSQRAKNNERINTLKTEDSDPKLTKERQEAIRENIAKLTQENQELERSMKASRKRAEQYNSHANDMESISQTSNDYTTNAERGSMKAMLQDRATSFGMAATGATAGVIGSSYMKGEEFNKGSRNDMFLMGNVQGRDDYHNVRKEMFQNGIDTGLGYSGQDLLSMNKSYMSYNGYNGKEDFDNGMQQYQRSGRALNIDQDTFEGTYEDIGMTGALEGKNGKGVESFTNTLVGALDKSKMTARSEEQVKALGDVVSTLGQTRNLSSNDLEDAVALQGSLASTGDRQLQGEKGAGVLNTLSNAMMQGKNDPTMLQAVGYGSELTGQGGRVEAQRRLEKGATAENVNSVLDYAGEDKDTQNMMLQHLGLSVEQSDAVIKARDEGKLDDEYLKNLKKESKKEGKDKADKDVENVKESKEGKANQSESKEEAMNSDLANKFDTVLKPLQGFVSSFGTGAFIIMKAATTLAASASFIAASTGTARGIRGAASVLPNGKRGGKQGKSGGATPRGGSSGSAGATGRARRSNRKSGSSDIPKAGNKTNSSKSSGASGIMAGMPFMGGAPGSDRGSSEGKGTMGKVTGGLGKMAGGLGKFAMPMAMMGGLSGMSGGTDENGEPQGSPMGGMLSTMLQWYLMDAVIGKGIGGAKGIGGKIKNADWKGMAKKGKGKVNQGKNIYKQKGAKGLGSSVGKSIGNLGKNAGSMGKTGWDKFANNKTVGKIEGGLGKGFDKTKDFTKKGLGKASKFGGQSAGLGKGATGGLLKGAGKIVKPLGAIMGGADVISGFKDDDSGKVGSGFGTIAGTMIGSLGGVPGAIAGGMIGDKAGEFAGKTTEKNNKAIKDGNIVGKGGLVDFNWSNGDKDGKGGLQDSPVGKAWGGITSLFGGGDKKDKEVKDKASKASVGKGGGGGGSDNTGDPRPNPMGTGNIPGTGNLLGLGGAEALANEGESGSDKAQKGEKKAKKNKDQSEKGETERLRQKNNESESKNLGIYRNLLTRAEQIIQEAKSLDLKGGSSGDDTGSASDVGGKGEKKIYDFLKGKGLSDDQTSAIMGNFYQESKLDPTAENESTGAYGIAQWAFDRKAELEKYAKGKGKDKSDLDTQLDFLWQEMSGSEKGNLGRFNNATNLEDATKYWANDFERMSPHEAEMGTRLDKAKDYQNSFGKGGKGGGGSANIAMPELGGVTNSINSAGSFGAQGKSGGNTVTDSRTFNININVSAGDNARDIAQQTGERIQDLLSGMETFANEYVRE